MLTFATFLINHARFCTPNTLIYVGHTSKDIILLHHENHIHSPSLPTVKLKPRNTAIQNAHILKASISEPPHVHFLCTPIRWVNLCLCTYVRVMWCDVRVYIYKFLCFLHLLPQALLRAFFLGVKLYTLISTSKTYIVYMTEVQGYKEGAKMCGKRKGNGFSNKCASLVKEQRARLYILRRCATMLLCWYIQGDDWNQILNKLKVFPFSINPPIRSHVCMFEWSKFHLSVCV